MSEPASDRGEPSTEAAANLPTGATVTARELVARLVRINNLLIFASVIVGLSCAGIVQVTKIYSANPPGFLDWLTMARIALPLLALIVTALVTQRSIAGLAARAGDEPPTFQQVGPLFFRCKMLSMTLLAVCGLFASTCLLFGHRTSDVLLALAPIVLMAIGRPTLASLLSFVGLAEGARRES